MMLSYVYVIGLVVSALTFDCSTLADRIGQLKHGDNVLQKIQREARKDFASTNSHNRIQEGATENDECPNIVSRADWNARPPNGTASMKTPLKFVIIHHTDGLRCTEYEECCAFVRGIQNFHMDYRGWNDIAYTFLAGEDGNIYEGRGWDTVGAHCPWYNNRSIGISVMGDFSKVMPSKNATDAVQSLIQCAVERGKLSPDYILYGHRQGRNGTTCPGDAFFKEIQSWPHWKPGNHFPPKWN